MAEPPRSDAKPAGVEGDGLGVLLPVVARWFRATYGEPTPPQAMGWPSIAAGRHTLIFAPTGSGKTLAAFLACLDHLWRTPRRAKGVRVLYVSPLKALNQDISRNLEFPLAGVMAEAAAGGESLEPITVGVRSGDTPQADRQRMVRRPPDVLITTPESLNLMLTGRARETLRSVTHVIVDEIHAVCANKRGVFLALLLERLEALRAAGPDPGADPFRRAGSGFVRVGLSATQRPLEEVARYLGGADVVKGRGGRTRFVPREVHVVDTGQRKVMDLLVTAPFAHRPASAGPQSGPNSVWPAIERVLLDLIRTHRSTIVFANNRRVVERLTAHLNELAGADLAAAEVDDDETETEDGAEAAAEEDAPDLARSHHGSLSQDERRTTEEALKRGELAAVVATASLELGIDMGAVDLVCQVESPGSVARGLQRVGRAGHLVGRVSKGRLIAKTTGDLLESAALCRKMARGEVEALRVPTNCLDVLAQQVVAAVAVDRWDALALYNTVRGAYPYRDLTAEAFEGVLKMVSGRFPVGTLRDLRARIGWDRVHNRLAPLPGTARVAIVNGGTIPDTGAYPVYLGEGGPRLGELDEEFVLERRAGETFVLGSATWRIEAIEPQRVLVGPASGQSALMPFWRGEDSPRSSELGEAVGALCREVAAGLDDPALPDRLRDDYRLDPDAAHRLRDYVARQVRAAGAVPDDRTVLIEAFRDPAGETGLAVLTPFGGKLHQALKLILTARLRARLGVTVACLHSNDGLIFRIPDSDEPPLDLFEGLDAAAAEPLLREELADSALFGLRFRQNAGRALLMPRPDPSKRTPLWLQRLRAKDLLQVVRTLPDFPVVAETYRECLNDDLDLPRLRAFLDGVVDGSLKVVQRRTEVPSPFVADLVFRFEHHFLYEWDQPRNPGGSAARSGVDDGLLDTLLEPAVAGLWLDPTAVGRVEGRLRGSGHPPRTAEEMAETLRRLGDLTPAELAGPMLAQLGELAAGGRAFRIELAGTAEPDRWVGAEERGLYASAFPAGRAADGSAPGPALESIVRRYLQTHALVGLDDLLARYPVGPALATELLERWADEGELVRLDPEGEGDAPRYADGRNLAEVRRLSVALRRRESVAVAPEVFADVLLRRQNVHPEARLEGAAAVGRALELLQGFAATAETWESEILPARVRDFRPAWLDEALGAGQWVWQAGGETGSRADPKVAFLPRDLVAGFVRPPAGDDADAEPLTDPAARTLETLGRMGASFAGDLARHAGLEPSRVRAALDELVRRGLVTNDRFDPLRPGAGAVASALAEAAGAASVPGRRGGLGRRPSFRRAAAGRPEGRWSRTHAEGPAADGDSAAVAEAWASVLFERYGVLTRETAALDPWSPPWRDLAPVLARGELRGEVRRGYFVEGLSGVQYATPEAAEALARHAGNAPGDAAAEPVMVATLDPANLYGSGAPLDVPLLEGGTARLPRSSGNFLVLLAGRPLLIVEGWGKRLTGLASASEDELRRAVALLPKLARPPRRALKVETYNGAATLAGPAAPWLAEAGFVRDHPGMAYYAGW